MKKFHFSKIYFNKEIVDDPVSKIRVVVKEIPSLEISEEEYSLRVSTRYENPNTIHRDYAIEHHTGEKHPFPHLQFKFHMSGIYHWSIDQWTKSTIIYWKVIYS